MNAVHHAFGKSKPGWCVGCKSAATARDSAGVEREDRQNNLRSLSWVSQRRNKKKKGGGQNIDI